MNTPRDQKHESAVTQNNSHDGVSSVLHEPHVGHVLLLGLCDDDDGTSRFIKKKFSINIKFSLSGIINFSKFYCL